jgi:hypothetical protein
VHRKAQSTRFTVGCTLTTDSKRNNRDAMAHRGNSNSMLCVCRSEQISIDSYTSDTSRAGAPCSCSRSCSSLVSGACTVDGWGGSANSSLSSPKLAWRGESNTHRPRSMVEFQSAGCFESRQPAGSRQGALSHGSRQGALSHGSRQGALSHDSRQGALSHDSRQGALSHGSTVPANRTSGRAKSDVSDAQSRGKPSRGKPGVYKSEACKIAVNVREVCEMEGVTHVRKRRA